MIKIISIAKGSKADVGGIRENDYLISINDHEINDLLDYHFYQSEEELVVKYSSESVEKSLTIEKSYDEDLGLEIETLQIKACSNNCVFCFIKQNPRGMRQSIYFCDEDYRYSFLYGNYITLTNLEEKELNRIVQLRLSPLYISVHATDPEVRKSIFRYRREDRLIEKLEFLNRHRIELHTQVVLVPGFNDGEVLENTVNDLFQFRKSLKTLAIVPVGLTKHRKRLPQLKTVSLDQAVYLVQRAEEWNSQYRNNEGDPFVYLSDEFYLLAKKPFPVAGHYGPFYQIENGVGLSRRFIDDFQNQIPSLPGKLPQKFRVLIITGKLAEPLLRENILPVLNDIDNLEVDVCAVTNQFFGEMVTVSGLLTGQDIIDQFPKSGGYDRVYLPPRAINENGLLLDDLTPQDIESAIKTKVSIGNDDLKEMIIYGKTCPNCCNNRTTKCW
jgi:putative radical SAM enzyme (TIGR03279 family)